MSISRHYEFGRSGPGAASNSRGKATSTSTVFKRLKKLVTSQPASSQARARASSPTSTETKRRRAEALKAVGLLDQSVKYGAPYRDEDDSKTIVSPVDDIKSSNVKDLLMFDEKEDIPSGTEGKESSLVSDNTNVMPAFSPGTPQHLLTKYRTSEAIETDSCSTVESEASTLAGRNAPIRMRRIGSLSEDIDQIEDEESRRLTEIAFLC